MSKANEMVFEDAITQHLVQHGGYLACKRGVGQQGPADFDAAAGVDTAELFAFIRHNPGDPYVQSVSIPRFDRFKAKMPEVLK